MSGRGRADQTFAQCWELPDRALAVDSRAPWCWAAALDLGAWTLSQVWGWLLQ